MKNLIIDGGKFDSIESFYKYVTLLFPEHGEYFGENLDALFDILSDESFGDIIIKEYQKMRFELGDEFFVSLQEILFDLDVQWKIVFEV
jgi:RNAse (barnase) inhibitor barstar